MLKARPVVEPQVEANDCGYVCISAVMALLGRPAAVADVKHVTGTTFRGLTIKQVRDGLNQLGVEADAVFFDKGRIEAYPDLGVLLLDRGHFVVVSRKRRQSLEIYDPSVGWSWITLKRLKRSLSGFGISVTDPRSPSPQGLRAPPFHRRLIAATLEKSFLTKALMFFMCAQIFSLCLPLVTMKSVDGAVRSDALGFGGIVIVGFLALSFINGLSSAAGEFVQARLKQKMYRRVGGLTVDAILAKEPSWFDNVSGASIQNQLNSLHVNLDFTLECVRAAATLAITIVAGALALVFISPWLAIPGLVSLMLTTGLDLAITGRQRGLMSASVEASQRRYSFVLGTLVQMPLLVRQGSVRRCRSEYVRVMTGVGSASAALQIMQGWRTTLVTLLKATETIIFVTLAAWFMKTGSYSIGGFVALGAYKDLLAGALASAFQLAIRHNTMAIHRIQTGMLLDGNCGTTQPCSGMDVHEGNLSVRCVSFRYGTLDKLALRNVSFDLECGECLVVKGVSGAGKSTLAKLITGLLTPTEGQILVDGRPLAYPVRGLAAVLQTDRLISSSIRENVALYRRHVSDADIWRALELCRADEFVRELPMRLNSQIAEGMAGLSGGQKQRLMLARAVADRPKILLLDEATASLDVDTEAAIIRNLRQLDMTLIVISHRPEVWNFGDRTIEIAAGEVTNGSLMPGAQLNCA